MSHNNAEVKRVASELQAFTMDLDEVVVRSEVARANLAVCAWTVRWCTAVGRLRRVWLEGGSDLARVHRVLGWWRQS